MAKPNRFGSPYDPTNQKEPPTRTSRREAERRERVVQDAFGALPFTISGFTALPASPGVTRLVIDELDEIGVSPAPGTSRPSRKQRRQQQARQQREQRQVAARYGSAW